MRRIWLVVSLGLLCALAGLCAVLHSGHEATTIPLIPLQPSMPLANMSIVNDPASPVHGGGPELELGTADTTTVPQRVLATYPAARDQMADERVAVVEVLVVRTGTPGEASMPGEEGLPLIDVCLVLSPVAASASSLCGRTDPRGVARFEITGGDGRTVWASCALGAEDSVTLAADRVVRATLRITPRVLVQGSVVDAGGRGIGHAELVLLPWSDGTSEPAPPACVGHSRADGSFLVALAAGGRLGALHRDFAPSAMYLVRPERNRQKPVPTVSMQFVLLTVQARVQGTVLDTSHQPVAGAELEFRGAGVVPKGAELASPPQRVVTAGDGTFVAKHLPPGRIDYVARASGHGSARGSLEVSPAQVARLVVQLPAACAVGGQVLNADGTPVPGARLWTGSAGAFDSRATLSASDGRFRLQDLPPGKIDLTARDRNPPAGPIRQASTQIELAPEVAAEWTVILEADNHGPRLQGVVVDQRGTPLSQWRVVARAKGSAVSTVTADDGQFALTVPAAGAVDVRAYAPGQPLTNFAGAVARGVDSAAGPLRLTVDVFAATGSLHGRVAAAAQQPIPASIGCWHHERSEYVRFLAGADGTFDIASVPAGTIDLEFTHPGHATARHSNLGVRAGTVLDLDVITLDDAGILHGTVGGPDGRPPEQCTIAILLPDERLVADYVGGTYRFAAVPAGQHILQVQGPGVAAATFPLQIEAGVELQRDIQLHAGVPRRFCVTAPPAAGDTVFLAIRPQSPLPGSTIQWLGSLPLDRSGALGRAEFVAYMAPGAYEAVAWTREPWEARATAVFADGDDSTIVLELVRE